MAAALAAAVGLHAAQQNNQQAGGLQRNLHACAVFWVIVLWKWKGCCWAACCSTRPPASRWVLETSSFVLLAQACCALCGVVFLPDSSPAAGATLRV